jgi:hypothetical protein
MPCNYTPPNLAATGDDLYGPRVCFQPFINWAWDSFDFDRGDWDDGRGYSNVCDNRMPLNRAMAGIWCLTYSADNYQDENQNGSILQWGCKFARNAIDELDGVCVGGAIATTFTGAFTDDRTQLKIPFFDQAVSLRAGTLVHEARHADGKGHDSGGNDSSWGYNGAWRWQVCWLSWFNAAGTRTSAALKAMARQRGNNIINANFVTHPGFNI